jgi:hypothetical protein
LARVAGSAASWRAMPRNLLALRLRPEWRLPADRSLLGQRPAQLARCPALGNTDTSMAISATMTSAVRCATPVSVAANWTPACLVGPSSATIASPGAPICPSRKSRCAKVAPTVGLEAAVQRLAEGRDLRSQLPFGQLGQDHWVRRARDRAASGRVRNDGVGCWRCTCRRSARRASTTDASDEPARGNNAVHRGRPCVKLTTGTQAPRRKRCHQAAPGSSRIASIRVRPKAPATNQIRA